MMISPEMFYETYLKGKNVEEVLAIIKNLKREISKLKHNIENPNRNLIRMCPTEETKISCNRDYLQIAKMYLLELGYDYKPSQKEIRMEEFNNHLVNLKKITLIFFGYEGLPEEYVISIVNDEVVYKNNFSVFSNDDLKKYSYYLNSKETLIEALEDLYIGEWRKNYSCDRFGIKILDGTMWSLEIEFSDGFKTKKVYGNNSYPYNFDKLKKIFTIK